ncbi:hypothetical protein [Micromonospora sp. NPDC049282]|uniref:hypothetical protein n=1 Tax=Micromonospora sp. NPDC049282 TaxID=3364269 RepID=UPI00371FA6C5
MGDVLDLLHQTVTSPWVYLVIIAVTAVDASFPAVPGETVVITAGVFAAGGAPNLVAGPSPGCSRPAAGPAAGRAPGPRRGAAVNRGPRRYRRR